MKKSKLTAFFLVAALLLQLSAMIPAYAAGSGRFTDVPETYPGHGEIEQAAELGLFTGTSATAFLPNEPMTRAMFAVVLSRLAGVSTQRYSARQFSDVPETAWYAGAVGWAVSAGIANRASATTFSPGGTLTWAELADWLAAYADSIGIGAPGPADLIPASASAQDVPTRGEAAAAVIRFCENQPILSVSSTIFGSGDTGGKTSLKNILVTAEGPGDQTIRYSDPKTGKRLDYPVYNEDGSLFSVEQPPVSYTGSAVLRLFGPGVDDSKIDSSKAVVELLPGDGYYAGELVLKAGSLTGQWKDGALEYTLNTGDLEWYTGDYEYTDHNSGREWSVLGGDGNGVYTFNFQVSGITYDGQPVNAATFPVRVYIWGRTGTDLAPTITDLVPENHLPSGASQGSAAQWSWKGEQGDFMGKEAKPVLSDDKQDDFFLTWPAGTDASGLTAKDVAVTLSTQYGERLQLTASGEHPQYAVFSSKGETQVAVTFRHAAFTPVFTQMTIEVDNGSGLTASKTYDIASVYSYMVQQGGGGLPADGVCTAYSYYGYEGLSIDNAQKAVYTLKYTDAGGKTWYYNEKGGLSEAVEKTTQGFMGPVTALAAPDDAAVYDAMGKDGCDVRFIVNTLFVKTRVDQTEVKTVDGQQVVFTKEYSSGQIANWDGVSLAPGYVRTSGFSPNQQWAWSQYYGSGWSPELSVIPTTVPYTDGPFGAWADKYAPSTGGPGGPGGPGAGSSVEGAYTSGSQTLELGKDTFTLTYGGGKVEGKYTAQSKFNFMTKQTSTIVIPDADSAKKLAGAGVFPAWYSCITPNDKDHTFTVSKDVSYALMADTDSVYDIQTKANSASATGYTTTITVKDDGYENVYAFGDWVAVDKDGKLHGPDEWANGMNYAASSALPLVKNAGGDWELKADLASGVMGVICYHDVADAKDLDNVKPLKTSFYVPYDSEKQSDSFDWTPAFPASETGAAAGRVYNTTCTVDGTPRSVSVYTPAGYDAGKDGGYPVAYLIPGGGSNYLSWFQQGMVNNIFDNLTAAGKVEPTILVSMQREDVNGDNGRCLPGIIAWVEANFNAAQGAKNRALVGVSMGSVAATRLWLDDPERFQYYGFFSGGDKETFKGAGQEGAKFTYGELDSALLAKLKATTCYLGGGTTDFNMYEGDANSASVTDLDAWMDHYGITHNAKGGGSYDVTAGDHNWPIWMKLMIPCASDYLWK